MDDQTLLQILAERTEKAPDNVGFFISYHFQSYIIHCGNGSTGCYDGNTANETQQIQDAQVGQSSHEGKKFVVHVKNTVHKISSFVK
jgi:hypothetical protein